MQCHIRRVCYRFPPARERQRGVFGGGELSAAVDIERMIGMALESNENK